MLIDRAIEDGTFPGIDVSVVKDGKRVFGTSRGFISLLPRRRKLKSGSFFDLASLTKPLATAPVVLEICRQERISLSGPINRFIPELPADSGEITLMQLLTHTSGLPPAPDLNAVCGTAEDTDRKKILKSILSITPVIPSGSEIVYSCTGYIFLSAILERITGKNLPELYREIITEPAGIDGLLFNPADNGIPLEKIAPTELCDWRKRMIRGEVHDEISYCLGGQAGNAGLFGTVKGIEDFMKIIFSEGYTGNRRILSQDTVSLMTSPLSEKNDTVRTAGFLMQSGSSFAGNVWSKKAFGHTGFTGTSVWADPECGTFIVILTNRVHPERNKTSERIKDFRKNFHESLFGEFCNR